MLDKYNPAEIESKHYQNWEEQGYFQPDMDLTKPSFSIQLPPPNVTGTLHMGHAFNQTIMDGLTRYYRMKGCNTAWIPGTDHAGIATQIVVERQLAAQNVSRHDLGREKFLEKVWEWKEVSGGTITQQMRRVGCSADWTREYFTMDDVRAETVTEVFVRLYEQGLIYRGKRLVNWDPVLGTAVSDLEVESVEEQGSMWHIRYPLADNPAEAVIVATTRPETLLGDVAVAVNPEDERYTHLIGKELILPLTGRTIPVIADEYVEKDFGTGCVKITPAHDFNDYEVGKRHDTRLINVFDLEAKVLANAEVFNFKGEAQQGFALPEKYAGLDRFAARKQMVADLQEQGLLVEIKAHTLMTPKGDRTGSVIEPMLTSQWFVAMSATPNGGEPDSEFKGLSLADKAKKAVDSGAVRFIPENWVNTYNQWMNNIQDWCISRQLWWGHQIPAWYDNEGNVYVARNQEEAEKQAGKTGLTREEDVLDTWFSSALVPFSTLGWPSETDELKAFLPSNVLVTGYEIIFFWVARMIMAGYEYEKDKPFRSVYFTGIVRDKLGRKMSKSLGNSPDPLALIDQYGADGVRMGIMLAAPAGNDILFDESLCEQGRNFNNKIWNALRLVKSWEVSDAAEQPDAARIAIDWMEAKFCATIVELEDDFSRYRISEALMTAYKLFRDEFSAWYLEAVKPAYGRPIDTKTYRSTISLFERLMLTLHPFMPFITEEVWQALADRQPGESIMVTQQPCPEQTNDLLTADFEVVKSIVAGVRSIRLERNIPNKELLTLQVVTGDHNEAYNPVIMKMCNVDTIVRAPKDATAASFMVGTTEYAVPLGNTIDVAEEIQKMDAEIDYLEGFLRSVMKKLGNEKFVVNAKPEVVAVERKKRADAESKLALLRENVAKLKDNA